MMKRLLLTLTLIFALHILHAQNARAIPASTNPSAKKEATIEYNPIAPAVKSGAETSGSKGKKVKCVPGCSGRKQCIRKTSSAQNPPANSEEKASESQKK